LPETQADSRRGSTRERDERDILSRIVAHKRAEISDLGGRIAELRERAAAMPAARDFRSALSRHGAVALIAEVKRRSPGAGAIRPDLDPVDLARGYASAGASAISVLTDREFFAGSLEDLAAVRSAVPVPVLRKDFILSEPQVWEARAAGADAVLLIVAILDAARLEGLRALAEELGMTVLVEVHDAAEMERALDAGASVVGINNRDLRNFTTRLDTTLDLLSTVPEGIVLVSESGIRTRDDVARLGAAGVDAVLVGEALLRAPLPGEKARELSGVEKVLRSAGPTLPEPS
jgi:indole-3-glycerol phosphate synthase